MASLEYNAKGEQLKQNMANAAQAVKQAIVVAGEKAAEAIQTRGRADIAGGGRFGSNWTNAFNTHVDAGSSAVKITATMGGSPPIAYWKVFEFGATISAKNPSGMLWIPVDRSNKTWPRDYGGGLFRKGNALFDTGTKQQMYLGTPSVTIPQKFHLRDIIKQVASELRQFYKVTVK